MKTFFTGFHRTIEEHCAVISQKLSKFNTSTLFNGFVSKSVYVFHITSLVNCLNFIKIEQVVFEYSQLKVSNLSKSRIIFFDKIKHETMLTSNQVQCTNEKVQLITVINENP